MARPSNQSAAWEFTVSQLPMKHPNTGNLIPNLFGNFRDDTGACLGTTSEAYGLVQNTALMEAAFAAFDKRGLKDYETKVMTAGDGRRLYAEFTFKNNQLKNSVGDIFGYRLRLKNSFDRTLRAAFELGFLRLACLNGMVSLEKEFSATQKHSSRISVDFVADAVDKALASGPAALEIFDRMAAIALTDEQGINILRNLEQVKALSGVMRSPMETLWLAPRRQEDKGRTLYNLFNAITEHLTHQVESERYEYANNTGLDVLMRLGNAARKPEQLGKLLLPLSKPIVATVIDVESTVVPV